MNRTDFQQQVNASVREDIKALYKHAEIANGEMGAIKIEMAKMQGHLKGLCDTQKDINRKLWAIALLILAGLIRLFFK